MERVLFSDFDKIHDRRQCTCAGLIVLPSKLPCFEEKKLLMVFRLDGWKVNSNRPEEQNIVISATPYVENLLFYHPFP